MIENEIEKKMLLTKTQYENILSKLSNSKLNKITQINYYYDTEKFDLYNKGETLRVRQIENSLSMQLKYAKKVINGTRIAKEFSKTFQNLPKGILLNGIKTENIGFLLTERTICPYEKYTIFLDKNYYLGSIDYEIEIESSNFSNMPKQLFDLTFKATCEGKYTRFSKKKLEQEELYELSKHDHKDN